MIGAIIVVVLALAAVSGYRNRRRGRVSRPFGAGAVQNRVDAEVRANPFFAGGQDWEPEQKQDPER